MKKISSLLLVSLLQGCGAYYSYKNGDCELSILSAREVQAGDLRISKSCALSGKADGMTYSEKQTEIIKGLVDRIP